MLVLRRLPTLAAAFVIATAAASVVVAAVLDANLDPAMRELVGSEPGWVAGLAGLVLAIPGALLLVRNPRQPVAWVLCLAGVHWAVDGAAASWLGYAIGFDPPLPGASLAFWLYHRVGAALLLSLPLILLLYPDGKLPTGRWRVASLVGLAGTAYLPLALLLAPSRLAQEQGPAGGDLPTPFRGLVLDPTTIPLPDAVWSALLAGAYVLVPFSMVVPFAVVVRRFRAAEADDKVRMRWLLWAAVVDVMVMGTASLLPSAWTSAGLLVAVGLTGFAVAVGIARPHLVDVDRLLGATVLYAALVAVVLLVDVAVVAVARAMLGDRLGERDAAIVAILVVLAVYGPLRQRLWLLVRRIVLGRRDDRYGVVSGLAEQLERSDSPEEQLLTVARSVAQAFRTPYVAVEVDRTGGGRLLVEHGTPPALTQPLPITYRGKEVGRLVLPRRGFRAVLSAQDEQLLADVVRQAAVAAHTGYLAEELQRGREQIVAAREEERRRLRRDLHDGLGPSLGAVALRIETARNLARTSAADADRVLRQAREDVAGALADVRRLVHDLRPPALDDVGLLGAVRQQADRLRAPGLDMVVEGATTLDSLPAAIEVAAFRIASEALTNVARHAAATTCRVRLAVGTTGGGALVVEIVDDGVGIAAATAAGVGLASMRERAEELGGRCQVWCPDGGGTVVRAELPLPRGADAFGTHGGTDAPGAEGSTRAMTMRLR